MSLKIESNVPAPSARNNGKYPWREMKVGDSFFVEGATSQKLSNAARSFAKWHAPDVKFIVRADDGGVRVWRTA